MQISNSNFQQCIGTEAIQVLVNIITLIINSKSHNNSTSKINIFCATSLFTINHQADDKLSGEPSSG